ncbi:unnamed protein product [Angiostrongylus costaricensis]|uniref:MFS domain-containing protein n=1 Tax=Angiostrongylus costaricensis TaxID=334426 RepID=A0A0R3PHF8_ANGCS|nr:unnamed protein product [Angiostrongylus costaricensis]
MMLDESLEQSEPTGLRNKEKWKINWRLLESLDDQRDYREKVNELLEKEKNKEKKEFYLAVKRKTLKVFSIDWMQNQQQLVKELVKVMRWSVTRFHLVVLFTNLSAGLLNSQLIFAIFSNYSPKWQCGFANSWQTLHLVRFLLGLCIGGCLVTVGTFITELLLPEQRMLLRGVFNWGVVRLILTIVCMLVPEWRSASIVTAMFVPPAIVIIMFIFPESPIWLHSKGRIEAMREAEQYIANFSGEKYEYVEQKSIGHVKKRYHQQSEDGVIADHRFLLSCYPTPMFA